MTIFYEPLQSLDQRGADQSRTAENSTRFASAAALFDSVGQGEFQFADCFEFGLTFIEEPTVAYGYAVDGDTLVEGRYPKSWGFVARYRVDTRGYYTGAWCAAVVETSSEFVSTAVPPSYDLNHSFMFTGLAIKDLPADLVDDV